MISSVNSFKNDKRIILASASPRRRELLSLITDRFEVITADVDERAAEIKMEEDGVPALKVSEHLAEIKAKAVFDSLTDEEKEDSIVIGADTSVILDNIIFGKPADRDEAVRMLSLAVRSYACGRDRSRCFRGREQKDIYRRDACGI